MVRTKKNILKDSSWFGEPKRKLRSKVVHFFNFFLLCFLLSFKFCENGKHIYGLRTLLKHIHSLIFWLVLKLTWLILWDPHKVVARKKTFSTFPSPWKGSENRKLKNPWKKKRKKEKKPKVNLVLSHVNHIFLILDPQIGHQVFKHTHCILKEKLFFFNVKKSPIQGSICFKLVPGLLVPGGLSNNLPLLGCSPKAFKQDSLF